MHILPVASVVHIPAELLRAVVSHAHGDYPLEACGVLPGPRGGRVPSRWVPMVNIERSSSWFRFDPDAQLSLWREMDSRGEYPVVVYHSHPYAPAVPSGTDIAHMIDPQICHLVVSMLGDGPTMAGFRMLDGLLVEENVVCLDTGLDTRGVIW